MLGELPLVVTHEGRTFAANRSTYRRDDALQAGHRTRQGRTRIP